jgi:hypothetical protein
VGGNREGESSGREYERRVEEPGKWNCGLGCRKIQDLFGKASRGNITSGSGNTAYKVSDKQLWKRKVIILSRREYIKVTNCGRT